MRAVRSTTSSADFDAVLTRRRRRRRDPVHAAQVPHRTDHRRGGARQTRVLREAAQHVRRRRPTRRRRGHRGRSAAGHRARAPLRARRRRAAARDHGRTSSAPRWSSRATSARTSSSTCPPTTGGSPPSRRPSGRCRPPASTWSTWRSASSARPTEVWARLSTQATNFANGDTLAITLGVREGADRADHGDPGHPVRRPGHRARVGGVGGDPRPQPPRGFAGLGRHPPGPRRSPPERTSSRRTRSVRENIEAFARAVAGEAAYPIPLEEMVANARTFEAITRSALSGSVEAVR